MSNARAVRYRRLAFAEEDNAKADLLHRLGDDCDRGLLCTAEWLSVRPSLKNEQPPKAGDAKHSLSRTHINTDVENPFSNLDLQQATDLRTRRGRTSIGDAGSWRGIDDGGPKSITASMLTASAETETDHFGNCPVCGAYVDMRDWPARSRDKGHCAC
jgi:hypothetical protein